MQPVSSMIAMQSVWSLDSDAPPQVSGCTLSFFLSVSFRGQGVFCIEPCKRKASKTLGAIPIPYTARILPCFTRGVDCCAFVYTE